jgi:quercetin dioxygenase-like cupin family protein
MKPRSVPFLLTGLALFGLGVAAGQIANGPSDSLQRTEIARADLSGAPGMEVISSTIEYKPGDGIPRHRHHGVEAYYVLQGATVQARGEKPMTIPTGRSMLNLRDEAHGGWIVVGDTSLKLFTVHVVDKDKPLYDSAW